MKHILLAGGGTGGHIAPALAVGRLIEREGWARVSYACTERPVDRAMYRSEGERVHVLRSPRADKWSRILLPVTGMFALMRAGNLLRRLGVNAVLGTGGYSSFYSVVAARFSGIPSAVLDTNAVPGRSNRLASRFCKLAFTAFSGQEGYFHCPVSAVGIPLQERLSTPGARGRMGISEGERVVLFIGGSQGARTLNDLAMACPGGIRILLQCGEADEKRVADRLGTRTGFIVRGFVDDLSDWYSAADLAVARAGAQSLAELCSFGVPALFVPYPHAADDHQAANAMVAANAGGALMKRQDSIESAGFWNETTALLDDRQRLSAMSAAMKGLLPTDAAEKVSQQLGKLCR